MVQIETLSYEVPNCRSSSIIRKIKSDWLLQKMNNPISLSQRSNQGQVANRKQLQAGRLVVRLSRYYVFIQRSYTFHATQLLPHMRQMVELARQNYFILNFKQWWWEKSAIFVIDLIDYGFIRKRLEKSTDRCVIILPYWDIVIYKDSISCFKRGRSIHLKYAFILPK